jgi:tripartite-type tricarboxylate transporter receptor subunit TctC
MKRLFTIAIAAIAALPAFAEYSDKSITIVVPFAAEGPTCKVARNSAEALRKPLGNVAVIVDAD